MGVMPIHSPTQKKQKSTMELDVWTNDSPMAVARRAWVPLRPAVLKSKCLP